MQEKTLNKVGLMAVGMIDDNIESKKDAKGKAFKFYSFEYWLAKKYKKKTRSQPGSKAREKWMESARSAWESDKKNVTLALTGNMRSAIDVVKTDTAGGTATLGFENKEAAEVAFYHLISGAGKSRVRRNFWYFTEKQKKSLTEFARDQLAQDADFAKELIRMLQS